MPATPPRYLFHATFPSREESIRDAGLVAVMGEVYAAESPQDAIAFMALRLRLEILDEPQEIAMGPVESFPHPDAHGVVIRNGIVYARLPQVRHNDAALIVRIDTQRVPHHMRPGLDHNPASIDATSWVIEGTVPVDALEFASVPLPVG